jgi:hypothetical protein
LALKKENALTAGQVEQLKRQLDELTKQGTKLPKKTWVKAAGHKILDVLSSAAQTATKTATEQTVKIPLERPK